MDARPTFDEPQLEALLMEGISSGPARPLTEEDWAQIRAEAKRRAGAPKPRT